MITKKIMIQATKRVRETDSIVMGCKLSKFIKCIRHNVHIQEQEPMALDSSWKQRLYINMYTNVDKEQKSRLEQDVIQRLKNGESIGKITKAIKLVI